MTIDDAFKAVVETVEAISIPAARRAGDDDVFTWYPGDPEEAPEHDRVFVIVLRSGPDRVVTRGHCDERTFGFDLQMQYVVRPEGQTDDNVWTRMLLDGKDVSDALVGLRTSATYPGITHIQEGPSEYLYGQRDVVALRNVELTYSGVM